MVARLGKCADALVFSGYFTGDTELASHFIDALGNNFGILLKIIMNYLRDLNSYNHLIKISLL
jgi:hypothetical protein